MAVFAPHVPHILQSPQVRPVLNPQTCMEPCDDKFPVVLQVYDLFWLTGASGLPVFHLGVAVHDEEFSYGSKGVHTCKPGSNKFYLHRQALQLGHTCLRVEDVELARKKLKRKWRGSGYSTFTRNCQSFAVAFCERLGLGEDCIPERFRRFAALPRIFGVLNIPTLACCSCSCQSPGGACSASCCNKPAQPPFLACCTNPATSNFAEEFDGHIVLSDKMDKMDDLISRERLDVAELVVFHWHPNGKV